ncbi:MAG: hypothetical protein EPO59_20295 [Bosea sp. (in: a-proteobacteria)]|nr:MAG: hypothetical protein EPO59_20295 [Bosea sp. (in: a-proteobacteria)]
MPALPDTTETDPVHDKTVDNSSDANLDRCWIWVPHRKTEKKRYRLEWNGSAKRRMSLRDQGLEGRCAEAESMN